jgi:ribosomal protein L7Ae-like RNA K-turn-binding protein
VGTRGPAAPEGALRLLGLAARAGVLLPGTERVREAARSGNLRFAVVAEDTSDNSNDKLLPLLRKRRVPHVVAFTRNQLGAAVGRGPLSAVGIAEHRLAQQIRALLEGESGFAVRGTGS